mgnify:FL=1
MSVLARINHAKNTTKMLTYSARSALGVKTIGDEAYGASVGSGGGALSSDKAMRTAGKQLMAATQGHVYTAIRPITSVIAGQPLRVGVREKQSSMTLREGRLTTKEIRPKSILSKAPNQVKSIAEGV